jgi:hypothetical protein
LKPWFKKNDALAAQFGDHQQLAICFLAIADSAGQNWKNWPSLL